MAYSVPLSTVKLHNTKHTLFMVCHHQEWYLGVDKSIFIHETTLPVRCLHDAERVKGFQIRSVWHSIFHELSRWC